MTDQDIVVEWTGVDSVPRRLCFEPRSTGGHRRIEQRHNGEEWVTTGTEIVSDFSLDAPAAVIHNGETVLGGQ